MSTKLLAYLYECVGEDSQWRVVEEGVWGCQ